MLDKVGVNAASGGKLRPLGPLYASGQNNIAAGKKAHSLHISSDFNISARPDNNARFHASGNHHIAVELNLTGYQRHVAVNLMQRPDVHLAVFKLYLAVLLRQIDVWIILLAVNLAGKGLYLLHRLGQHGLSPYVVAVLTVFGMVVYRHHVSLINIWRELMLV